LAINLFYSSNFIHIHYFYKNNFIRKRDSFLLKM